MGSKIQWMIHLQGTRRFASAFAANEEMIRVHAVSRMSRIQAVIDPVTAKWQRVGPQ